MQVRRYLGKWPRRRTGNWEKWSRKGGRVITRGYSWVSRHGGQPGPRVEGPSGVHAEGPRDKRGAGSGQAPPSTPPPIHSQIMSMWPPDGFLQASPAAVSGKSWGSGYAGICHLKIGYFGIRVILSCQPLKMKRCRKKPCQLSGFSLSD